MLRLENVGFNYNNPGPPLHKAEQTRRAARFVEHSPHSFQHDLDKTHIPFSVSLHLLFVNEEKALARKQLEQQESYPIESFFHDTGDAQFYQAWRLSAEYIKTLIESGNVTLAENVEKFGRIPVIAAMAHTLEESGIYREFLEFQSYHSVTTVLTSPKRGINEKREEDQCYHYLNSFLNDLDRKSPHLPADTVLYRGCAIPFPATPGTRVRLMNLTSTITDFDSLVCPNKPIVSLFEFTGVMSGVKLGAMSEHPEEEEVFLFPYQDFVVQGIRRELRPRAEFIQGIYIIQLYSPLAEIIETFKSVNQHFPPDPEQPDDAVMIYQIDAGDGEKLMLKNWDIQKIGYQSRSLENVAEFPEYHLILLTLTNVETVRFSPIIGHELFVVNFAALHRRWLAGEPIYIKAIKVNANNRAEILGEIRWRALHPTHFQYIVSVIEGYDPKFDIYNCYCLSDGTLSRFKIEQQIKQWIPARFHLEIRLCPIKSNLQIKSTRAVNQSFHISVDYGFFQFKPQKHEILAELTKRAQSGPCRVCGEVDCKCGFKKRTFEFMKNMVLNEEDEDPEDDDDVNETESEIVKIKPDSGRYISANTGEFKLGSIDPYMTNDYTMISRYKSSFQQANSDDVRTFHFKWHDRKFGIVWRRICSDVERRLAANDETLIENIERYGKNAVIAAMVYSLENPSIFKEFNQSVRNETENLSSDDKKRNDCYVSLFQLLSSMEPAVPDLSEDIVLYRGCTVKFDPQPGQVISLIHFTSTTEDPAVTEEFVAKSTDDSSSSGTIIKFTGLLSGIPLSTMSEFMAEKEVLLFPYQTFLVESVETINNGSITEITLRSVKKDALELFQEVNQHFPQDAALPENVYYKFAPSEAAENEQKIHYILRTMDLNRAGYVYRSFENATELPDYHILCYGRKRMDLSILEIRDLASLNRVYYRQIILPNFPNLYRRYRERKPIYSRYCTEMSEYELMNVVQILECSTFDDYLSEISGQVADPDEYNCYVLTGQLISERDLFEQIRRLFPARFHSELRVRQIECKSLNESQNPKRSIVNWGDEEYEIDIESRNQLLSLKKVGNYDLALAIVRSMICSACGRKGFCACGEKTKKLEELRLKLEAMRHALKNQQN